MKLYLDIDGVLITVKNPSAAAGVDDFIEYITTSFDCYWLTTHCKGCAQDCIYYLKDYLSDQSLRNLTKVKPTVWDTLKTDAINLEEDFIWSDDYPLTVEKTILDEFNKGDSLVIVNLKNDSKLSRIIRLLQRIERNTK